MATPGIRGSSQTSSPWALRSARKYSSTSLGARKVRRHLLPGPPVLHLHPYLAMGLPDHGGLPLIGGLGQHCLPPVQQDADVHQAAQGTGRTGLPAAGISVQ